MTLFVASQRVFIVVCVYIVIDSIRKLLDSPLYSLRFGKTVMMLSPENILYTLSRSKCQRHIL